VLSSSQEETVDNNRGLLYFCLGCATGVVGALLVNSKAGRDTWASVLGRANEGVNDVSESIHNLKDTVSGVANRGLKTVRHEAENVSAAVEAGKDAYREARKTTP
jgi:phage-related protein